MENDSIGFARRRETGAGRSALAALVLLAGLAAWGCSPSTQTGRPGAALATMPVTMPDRAVIQAELALTPAQQAQGLMFRTELAPDRGMLFVDQGMMPRSFWMYQTLIPLDIIWMDNQRRIVDISENTPPCPPELGRDCPNYGGEVPSQYVLELAAGQIAARGLKIGDVLNF